MRMYDVIMKKRNGGQLSKEEIKYIVEGYTNGTIPDYQMSAFLMAVYFVGMNEEETVNLTIAMADSGDRLDLSKINGIKVDKHSTGGVGDKTSLIIGPILAALDVPIAKMSGRGLGHTGGTIDKLESIEGFNTSLTEEQFINNVNTIGLAIVGQTANLAPADKKIYALRDVTATVDNYSLIASSIMSKKLAAGADVIVLDVKTGSGAFMQTEEEAINLAKAMVSIGTMAGKETYAVITDMNEPLGNKVGNSLEVIEAIEILNGNGDQRLLEISITLASYMLLGAKKVSSIEEAREKVLKVINDKSALTKFAEFVSAQGGDSEYIYNVDKFTKAKYIEPVYIGAGYLSKCNTSEVGMVSLMLGGGRATKDSEIDLTVGIDVRKSLGDYIDENEPLAYLYANDKNTLESAKERLIKAYTLSNDVVECEKCVKCIITKEDL